MTRVFPFSRLVAVAFVGVGVSLFLCLQVPTSAEQAVRQQLSGPTSSPAAGALLPASSHRALLDRYCVSCHSDRAKTGGLSLERIDPSKPDAEPEVWEKVVRKVHTGTMPPPNMPQPSKDDRHALVAWLQTELDEASAAKPNPGRTETLRRLNRTEYQNAIRDLLALEIDAASLLPA